MQKYNKFVVAIVGGIVAALTYLYGTSDWLPVVVNLLTALGVYRVPNSRY